MVSAWSSLNHDERSLTASEPRHRATKIFVRSEGNTVDADQEVAGPESDRFGSRIGIDVGHFEGTMDIGEFQLQPKQSARNVADHRLR